MAAQSTDLDDQLIALLKQSYFAFGREGQAQLHLVMAVDLGKSIWRLGPRNGRGIFLLGLLVLAVIFATTMRQGALAGRLRVGRRRLAEEAPAAPEQAPSPSG